MGKISVESPYVRSGDEYSIKQVGGSISITDSDGDSVMLVPKEIKKIVKERSNK